MKSYEAPPVKYGGRTVVDLGTFRASWDGSPDVRIDEGIVGAGGVVEETVEEVWGPPRAAKVRAGARRTDGLTAPRGVTAAAFKRSMLARKIAR